MEFACTKNCSFMTRSSDLIQYHIERCEADEKDHSDLNDVSVHDKLDADICPVCQDVFYTATELMKHVFDEHYCLTCLESCRHGVSTNKLALSKPQNVSVETQTGVISTVTPVTPNVVSVDTQVDVTHVTPDVASVESQTDFVTPVTSVTSIGTNTETVKTSVTSNVTRSVTTNKVPTTKNSVRNYEPKMNNIKIEESIESDASLPWFEDLNNEGSNSIYKSEPNTEMNNIESDVSLSSFEYLTNEDSNSIYKTDTMSEESCESGGIWDNTTAKKDSSCSSNKENDFAKPKNENDCAKPNNENVSTQQTIKIRTDLIAHPTTSRDYDIKCDICDKVVKNAKGLEQHRLAKHSKIVNSGRHTIGLTTYYSNSNSQRKSSKIDLLMKRPHKRTREPSTDLPRKQQKLKSYKCDQCHKSYVCENDLRSHVEIIHNVVKVKCRFCSRLFDSKGHEMLHVSEVHK